MGYSLDLQQKPTQNLKQLQRLIMSRQMQQAIHLLQMPVMELSTAVELEMQQNPLIEYLDEEVDSDPTNQSQRDDIQEQNESPEQRELQFEDHDFEILRRLDEEYRDCFFDSSGGREQLAEHNRLHQCIENNLSAESTLFEHLMQQAREAFETPEEVVLAEALIGNFDDSGFLKTSLDEIAVMQKCDIVKLENLLRTIQGFYPPGVGARDLRESLLIQLRLQNKQNLLAYDIIDRHFEDLLHNRIPSIIKSLHCTSQEVSEMVDRHIVKLDLHPGAWFVKQVTTYIIPDAFIQQEGDRLIVSLNEHSLPPLRVNHRYLRMLDDENLDQETKEFIQQKLSSAKWLLRNIFQRNETIENILNELIKRQSNFLKEPDGQLVPMTMKTIAEELHLHESTIARAVSNKYVDTPRGLLLLRSFFTNAIATDGDKLSSKTVKDLVKEMILNEDKSRPFSDEEIAIALKNKGISCARRTVAKYRGLLNIGTAQQRRKF